MRLLSKHSLLLILALALAVRLSAHFILNQWLFQGEFFHPDSYLYEYVALGLKERWDQGQPVFAPYPFYSTLIAPFYYLPGQGRLWAEGLNIMASLVTVWSGYKVVEHISPGAPSKIIAGLIMALSPFDVYLSTQMIRDSLLMTLTAVSVYAGVKARHHLTVGALTLLGLLRLLQAAPVALLPWLIYRKRRWLLLPLYVLIISFLFAYLPGAIDLHTGSPLPPNANTQGLPHVEFFGPTGSANIYYRQPWNSWEAILNPLTYLKGGWDFLAYPYPWTAGYSLEYAFAGHMAFWYALFLLGGAGVAGLGRKLPREAWILLGWALVCGVLLAVTSYPHTAFIRWRTQLYFAMMPALSIGLAVLATYEVRQRVMDLVGASVLMVLLSLPALIISLALKMARQPVFFAQYRTGLNGEPFPLYKFTTMRPGSDGVPLFSENGHQDPRVTPLGRWLRRTALDEIPELWSILKGDMSLVGPRALACWEDMECREKIPGWESRYQVKPGMIGPAQLKSNRRDNIAKLAHDQEYIARRSTQYDVGLIVSGLLGSVAGRWK